MDGSIQHNWTAIEAFGPLTTKGPGSLQRCHRYCGSKSKYLRMALAILRRFETDRGESKDHWAHVWDHWAQSVSAWYMTASLVAPGCHDPRDNSSRKSPLKAEKE